MQVDIVDNGFRFHKSGFSNGKLVLLNGKELECYEKKTVAVPPLTGKDEKKAFARFFANNAFFLLENADRVFADSRMFLAPILLQSGLAYSGTNGFNSPVLGAYLEWWLYGNGGRVIDANGAERLVLGVSGSPLSGTNFCPSAYDDGHFEDLWLRPFGVAYHSFINHNQRYREAKNRFEAYSLEEVVKLLKVC